MKDKNADILIKYLEDCRISYDFQLLLCQIRYYLEI